MIFYAGKMLCNDGQIYRYSSLIAHTWFVDMSPWGEWRCGHSALGTDMRDLIEQFQCLRVRLPVSHFVEISVGEMDIEVEVIAL